MQAMATSKFTPSDSNGWIQDTCKVVGSTCKRVAKPSNRQEYSGPSHDSLLWNSFRSSSISSAFSHTGCTFLSVVFMDNCILLQNNFCFLQRTGILRAGQNLSGRLGLDLFYVDALEQRIARRNAQRSWAILVCDRGDGGSD